MSEITTPIRVYNSLRELLLFQHYFNYINLPIRNKLFLIILSQLFSETVYKGVMQEKSKNKRAGQIDQIEIYDVFER